MTPISLDIPKDRCEQVDWLESHLLGLQLGDLVAELQVVHGTRAYELSLDQALGESMDSVLQKGLAALDEKQLRQLLEHPQLLLSLQNEVVLRGSEYWLQLPLSREEEITLASQWKLLETVMLPPASAPVSPAIRGNWFGQATIAAVLSVAALLLIAFSVRDRLVPASAPGWGWEKPGVLAVQLPPRQYLEQLANAAQDWFKKRPENASDLARRIAQFRQGCSTLILTEHTALAQPDRDWLVERCRAWAAKLDAHLIAIESGEDISSVRAAADETISKLIMAIRDRAQTIG